MDKLYVYRAACRKDMRLSRRGDGSYTLAASCEGCPLEVGASLQSLMNACKTCIVQWTGPSAEETKPMENSKPSGGNNSPSQMPVVLAPPPGGIAPVALMPSAPEPGSPVEGAMVSPVEAGPSELGSQVEPWTPRSQEGARFSAAGPNEANKPRGLSGAESLVVPASPGAIVVPGDTSQLVQPARTPQLGTPESALLGSLLMGLSTGEESVDVDAVLAEIPGLAGGPSEGGFSWHTLELPMQCWYKAYLTLVRGLVPRRPSPAFGFGSAYHACWEIWYKSGGQRRYDEPCDALRQAGAPQLAGHVQRLVYVELQKYAQQEADEWDIRAIEQNAVFWGEPERINGKLVHLPYCCRHDMLIAKRQPGASCAPPGPVRSGIWVVDRKTASQLTYDLTKGYAMDGQFLMNALVYKRSSEERDFGPFVGMIFAVAVKHKEPSPEKSYFRVETSVEDETLNEFYCDEIRPYAIELYRRLASPEYRGNPRLWAKNRASCVGRYGCCRFFDACDAGGESIIDALYRVDEKRIFDLEKLAEPPVEVKRAARATDPKKQAAEEARRGRSELKKHHATLLTATFRAAALDMPHFKSERYLVPNHTRKTVLDQLVLTLGGLWAEGTSFPFGPDGEGNNYQLTVTAKGLSWHLDLLEPAPEPAPVQGKKGKKAAKPLAVKGAISWKNIAEAICQDWWDLRNLEPKGR